MKKLVVLALIIFQTTLLMGMYEIDDEFDEARLEVECNFDALFAAKNKEIREETEKRLKVYAYSLTHHPEDIPQERYDNIITRANMVLGIAIIDNPNVIDLLRSAFNKPDHLKAFQEALNATNGIVKMKEKQRDDQLLASIIRKWGEALKLVYQTFSSGNPADERERACAATLTIAFYSVHTEPLSALTPVREKIICRVLHSYIQNN